MKPCTIAFRGNFLPSHSTESHVSATMEAMGHRVIRIQENKMSWEQTVEAAQAADIFWWTCTWHEDLDGGHAALRALTIPTVSHHLDLYVGLHREGWIDTDPFWRTKYVFTADGGHDDYFAAHGVNHHWIRPGVYDAECRPGYMHARWRGDIAFIGNYRHYHKEWPYRVELIDWLRRTYGSRYKHYAGGVGPVVRGQDLNDVLASTKIIIGDSLCFNFTQPNYWSDRVYETLGRGGFMIHPYIPGMEQEFIDGEHLRFYRFGDFDQLHDLIHYYLRDKAERTHIQRRGHEFVKRNATYRNRLAEIFAVLEQSEPQLRAREELRVG